ncbi:MAG: lipid-A-disaccharide synthase [Nitrospirae bacterium]|nr:lipid-A-disaccharide synthase [Nitrospirota bacterium]
MPRIFIITGEASGDLHGAHLAQALREADPNVELHGVGGPHMAAVPVTLLPGIERVDVIGVPGPKAVMVAIGNLRRLAEHLRATKWDAVVLVDHPGTNLRVARFAKQAGHRVVYYIAPQFWAWRPGRIRQMQQYVDHVAVILPFEPELYRRAGVRCTFVGRPLLDAVAPSYDQAEVRRRLGLASAGPIIGLLPGSREQEVHRLLPLLLESAGALKQEFPNLGLVLAQARSVSESWLNGPIRASGLPVAIARDQANEVMAASDLLLVASGTATLQAAIVGTPMIITYRTSWVGWQIAKRLVRVQWAGLANLVAGREIIPELIQSNATVDRMVSEALRLLRDRPAWERMRGELRAVRDALGTPGASRRAAQVVLSECRA